jgi:hypothetical protein
MRTYSLEEDLKNTDWLVEKVKIRSNYAQNLYAAMCNMQWQHRDMWPQLKEEYWTCTWRYSGGIIADIKQEGDYLDWYCSGMGIEDLVTDDLHGDNGYVPEGTVTDEIEQDLYKLGWIHSEYSDNE